MLATYQTTNSKLSNSTPQRTILIPLTIETEIYLYSRVANSSKSYTVTDTNVAALSWHSISPLTCRALLLTSPRAAGILQEAFRWKFGPTLTTRVPNGIIHS